MSDFWESFESATTAAIATMGEEILLDGEAVTVVVEALSSEEVKSPGGRKSLVNCRVLVPATVVLRDGMAATVRGAEGKVGSWEAITPDGNRWVTIGSANRWSGAIPGL